jgi:hypothetical protein
MIAEFVAVLLFVLLCLYAGKFTFRQFYRFPNRTEDDIASFIVPIEVDELFHLTDYLTEEMLQCELGHEEFRRRQFKRILQLQQNIRWMMDYADVMQEWGEYGYHRRRHAEEDGIKASSQRLIKACRHFRYGARYVQMDLYIQFLKMKLFPARPAPMLSRLRKLDASFDLLFAFQDVRIATEYLTQAYGEDCFERLGPVL